MLNDLRYGLRMLTKNPGFTAVAVATLALGIGANAAIFTVVYSVLLRPLRYPHPERLFLIGPLSDVEYMEYEKQSQAFEHLAAFNAGVANLTGAGEPMLLRRCQVTASFRPTLAIAAATGRTFAHEERNGANGNVAVLSDKLWRSRFQASSSDTGR